MYNERIKVKEVLKGSEKKNPAAFSDCVNVVYISLRCVL